MVCRRLTAQEYINLPDPKPRGYDANPDGTAPDCGGCVSCSSDECQYCRATYASASETYVVQVSGAGDYVVAGSFGESEPGAGDGPHAGTYSLNGTYVFNEFDRWVKTADCVGPSNNCFDIYYVGGVLTIYGEGPAGFPAWTLSQDSTDYNVCPPKTLTGWVKNAQLPNGITVNDPPPTVTITETRNIRGECVGAGGLYIPSYPGLPPNPGAFAECWFVSVIDPADPAGLDDCVFNGNSPAHRRGSALSSSSWWVYRLGEATGGRCCSGYCEPGKFTDPATCRTVFDCEQNI